MDAGARTRPECASNQRASRACHVGAPSGPGLSLWSWSGGGLPPLRVSCGLCSEPKTHMSSLGLGREVRNSRVEFRSGASRVADEPQGSLRARPQGHGRTPGEDGMTRAPPRRTTAARARGRRRGVAPQCSVWGRGPGPNPHTNAGGTCARARYQPLMTHIIGPATVAIMSSRHIISSTITSKSWPRMPFWTKSTN